MKIDEKYYRLGFREEETGVYPTPMEEINSFELECTLKPDISVFQGLFEGNI